jgi:hypothetical protein
MCCVFSFRIQTLNPIIKALGLLAGNCEYPTFNRIFCQKDGSQTPGESTLIKDRLHPGHKNSWNLLGALNHRVTHAIVTADELIIVFGWLTGAFNKKVQVETALSESLGHSAHESSTFKPAKVLGPLRSA